MVIMGLSNNLCIAHENFSDLVSSSPSSSPFLQTLSPPALSSASTNSQSCSPSKGGETQASCDSIASLGNTSDTNQGAGNPINIIHGNKYQREDDLPALPGVLGLEIVRHYNSHYAHTSVPPGILGRGWKLSYETTLYKTGHTLQIVQADGARIIFNQDTNNPSLCATTNPAHGTLTIETTPRGNMYHWRWNTGKSLHFNAQGKLERIQAPTGEFVSLLYDATGWLVRVIDPQGRTLQLKYLDKAQAKTRFSGVQTIDSPVGRFSYQYGSQDSTAAIATLAPTKRAADAALNTSSYPLMANLIKVGLPTYYDPATKAHAYANRGVSSSAISRHYHYEDTRHPLLLTGISVAGKGSDGALVNTRLSTWAYNEKEQANLSVKGNAKSKLERIELDYSQPGITTLTNSLGQRTLYRHAILAGEHRLLEVRGTGCAQCGEVNQRYRYDALGRLTDLIQLDDSGNPLYTTQRAFDAYGRITSITRITYGTPYGTLTNSSPLHGKNGNPKPFSTMLKPSVITPLLRYEYPENSFRASVIAVPSVVAGKEHRWQFSYNTFGQLTHLKETGWSPQVLSSLAYAAIQPIERNTHYTYTSINGRSVLQKIESPGSSVAVEWDKRANYLTAIVQAGAYGNKRNERILLEQDDTTGRLNRLTTANYVKRWEYTSEGNILAVATTFLKNDKSPARTDEQRFLYDALGHLTESQTKPNQVLTSQKKWSYDLADHLLWEANTSGKLKQAHYDSEGKLIRSTVFGLDKTHPLKQEEQYRYDAAGRVIETLDAAGLKYLIRYNAAGLPTETIDPSGISTEYQYTPLNDIASITQAANTLQPLKTDSAYDAAHRLIELNENTSSTTLKGNHAVRTQFYNDDFGREIAHRAPDSGLYTRRYDAADRVIEQRDADNNQIAFQYDHDGRLLLKTVKEKNDSLREETRFEYASQPPHRLIKISHPQQSEYFDYTDEGLLTKKTIDLTLASGKHVQTTTHYRYNQNQELIAQTLPDNSELRFERNTKGEVIALNHASQNVMQRFSSPLVKNIQRDALGLSQLTYGNGIEAHWQRSPEGILARLVYRRPSAPKYTFLSALTKLLPTAYAAPPFEQTKPSNTNNKPSPPGALALPTDPDALWDARYLFDNRGNMVFQGAYAPSKEAQSAAASLTRSSSPQPAINHSFSYDALNHLIQDRRLIPSPLTFKSQPQPHTSNPSNSNTSTVWRYWHDNLGNRVLSQENQPIEQLGATLKLNYQPGTHQTIDTETSWDSLGRMTTQLGFRYTWNSQGQLQTIVETKPSLNIHNHAPNKPRVLATYRYNHRGERISKTTYSHQDSAASPIAHTTHYLYENRQRIAELDDEGHLKRQYIWLADQLIAVIDFPTPKSLIQDTHAQTAWQKLLQAFNTIGKFFSQIMSPADSKTFIHSNHLGAPILATNQQGKVIWESEYAPFGKRLSSLPATNTVSQPHSLTTDIFSHQASFKLDLRLPGQWEDEESGLYYNDFRYYNPDTGRYLSADPLSTLGLTQGLNPYAYVQANPMIFSDPLGLILFAFDGTGNSKTPSAFDSLSNVYKFYEAYIDKKFYITGIGTTDERMAYKGSVITGDGFAERLNLGFKSLDDYINANKSKSLDIDIIGFSRGAAEARAWSNQLLGKMKNGMYSTSLKLSSCLNLRFLGLWDTVPHLGSIHGNEEKYNFAISPAITHVAHAMAVNEHRGGATDFNTWSIFANSQQKSTAHRIEKGFVGSHADIGGGYGTGDLSDVALMWMIQQAQSQGIKFNEEIIRKSEWNEVTNPIIHDKSANNLFPKEGTYRDDRKVTYTNINEKKLDQTKAPIDGMNTTTARSFVSYLTTFCDTGSRYGENPAVGGVNMRDYSFWLNQNYSLTIDYRGDAQLCK